MLGSNMSILGVSASRLDNGLNTLSSAGNGPNVATRPSNALRGSKLPLANAACVGTVPAGA